MRGLLHVVVRRRVRARFWFYTTSVLGAVAAFLTLKDHFSDWYITLNIMWLLGIAILLAMAIFELVYHTAGSSARFSGSQNLLVRKISPLSEMIEQATEVDLIGGTFKSFTDREENLKALAAHKSSSDIRIIMQFPGKVGMRIMTSARQDRKPHFSGPAFEGEVVASLRRMYDELGERKLCRMVRLCEAPPTFSVYRFDERYLLTLYTYGRGASSPALFIERGNSSSALCESVKRGIKEMWDAKPTIVLTEEVLIDIGVVS